MSDFKKPSLKNGKKISDRKFGFEFEFAGTSIEESTKIIKELFSGKINKKNTLEYEINNTDLGNFKVELDSVILKGTAEKLEHNENTTKQNILDAYEKQLSKLIGDAASSFVPCEIVTPPIKFSNLKKLETLRKKLHEKGAKGTKDSFINAFGTHINPEISSDKVEYIHSILKAFLVLYPWLKESMQVDITRRILSYIDPFPKEYIQLCLKKKYSPNINEFIKDYLEYNPTRNRALDLLPLFLHLNSDSLNDLPEDTLQLVNSRPTFHYRLANCDIDNKEWSVAKEWNFWIMIEELADDKDKLEQIAHDYLQNTNSLLNINEKNWIEILKIKYNYA